MQHDAVKAQRMRDNTTFGRQGVHGSVQQHLRATDERYRAAYLDLCGTWRTQLGPALEALFSRPAALPADGSPLLLGVTWGTRESGVSGLTEAEAERELHHTLMQHAAVTQLRVSQFKGMRTRFYELARKRF